MSATTNEASHIQLIGTSPAIADLKAEVDRVARSDAKVLITGESGSGKEVVARAINGASVRATQPFVPVNCAGIPETLLESELLGHVKGSFTGAYRDKPGKLEMANHGTIFLDEIGEMTLRMQGLLLRFLETGEIQKVGAERIGRATDVRVVAATNRNLRELITQGTFREDLFYRLNVIHLVVPPLRERREDIPLLVDHFLRRYNRRFRRDVKGITPDALGALGAYDFPGNVRELENVIERAFAMGAREQITLSDLPVLGTASVPAVAAPASGSVPRLADVEKDLILRALAFYKDDKEAAASALGIDLQRLADLLGGGELHPSSPSA